MFRETSYLSLHRWFWLLIRLFFLRIWRSKFLDTCVNDCINSYRNTLFGLSPQVEKSLQSPWVILGHMWWWLELHYISDTAGIQHSIQCRCSMVFRGGNVGLSVSWQVGPPLGLGLKYLNKYWMGCHKSWFRHSWFQTLLHLSRWIVTTLLITSLSVYPQVLAA